MVKRVVTVKVPAGFDDGMTLRYSGEGEAGTPGAPRGDLYVFISVRPHETLRREGDDLIAEAPVTMAEAALGAEITIEGVDGPETVRIPAGTQPSRVITLKRKGVPRLRGNGRGNLHVVCKVEIPKKLTSKQKKLLQEFAALTKKKGLFS